MVTLGALVIVAAGLYVWRREGIGDRHGTGVRIGDCIGDTARPEGGTVGKDGTA